MNEENELDRTIITYQSPYENAFSVNEHIETWPELIIEFSKVLNKAGYQIPIDLVEKYLYNGVDKEHQHRLEVKKLEGQLDLDFGE